MCAMVPADGPLEEPGTLGDMRLHMGLDLEKRYRPKSNNYHGCVKRVWLL